MATKDVLLENLSIKLLALGVVPGEPLLRMWDENATIRGALQRTKHARSCGCALEANIEVALERARCVLLINRRRDADGPIGLSDTLILVSQAQLIESATSDEKTSRIS